MDNQRIIELIQILESSQLTALQLSEGTSQLRLERGTLAAPAAAGFIAAAAPMQTPASGEALPDAAATGDDAVTPTDLVSITAPMVGVFHPLKKPVAMGDTVKKGQPVCIVEAMKLMNDIPAEEDGEVAWIAAQDGDMVEYGQVLMQIRRRSAT